MMGLNRLLLHLCAALLMTRPNAAAPVTKRTTQPPEADLGSTVEYWLKAVTEAS